MKKLLTSDPRILPRLAGKPDKAPDNKPAAAVKNIVVDESKITHSQKKRGPASSILTDFGKKTASKRFGG